MSLYSEFLAAVDKAATEQRCARGFTHPPHDTTTGRCPGQPHIGLTPVQIRHHANTVRQEIHHA